MRLAGIVLMFVGVLALLYALKIDDALGFMFDASDTGGAITLDDRYPYLIGASIITVLGALLSVLAQQRRYDEDTLDRLVELSFYRPKERDLEDAAYRNWLSVKYQIEQQRQAGGFLVNGEAYNCLDAALQAAHNLDLENDR